MSFTVEEVEAVIELLDRAGAKLDTTNGAVLWRAADYLRDRQTREAAATPTR